MGRSVGADIIRQCVEHARRAEPTPRGSIPPERCLAPEQRPPSHSITSSASRRTLAGI